MSGEAIIGNPFIGEIRLFAGNFAPTDWAFCDGSVVGIAEFSALFNLIGTTYGGDGLNTFALPDLRSRTPIHFGAGGSGVNYVQGQSGGVESVTLTTGQVAAHNHELNAVNSGASAPSPAGALPGVSSSQQSGTLQYAKPPATTNFTGASIGPSFGGQPHSNLQPYVTISFIISLFGIFPSQA